MKSQKVDNRRRLLGIVAGNSRGNPRRPSHILLIMRHLQEKIPGAYENTKIFLTGRANLIVFAPSFRGFCWFFRSCCLLSVATVSEILCPVRELRECFITSILKNQKSAGNIGNEFAHVAQG